MPKVFQVGSDVMNTAAARGIRRRGRATPPGRAAARSIALRVCSPITPSWRYLSDLLQPTCRATGAVVDCSVEHEQSERGRQAIPRDPLPVVVLVKCLRSIEGEVGDIQVGVSRGADTEPGSATDAGADRAAGPVAWVGGIGSEVAFVADHDIEHSVKVAHTGQPGLSLSAIGVDVAASGKLRFQLVARSAPISQPAGFALVEALSVTALPWPIRAEPYG